MEVRCQFMERDGAGFNEAEARAPRMAAASSNWSASISSFNEAEARAPRMGRHLADPASRVIGASMRPRRVRLGWGLPPYNPPTEKKGLQ